MKNVPEDAINRFVRACREAAAQGLARCSSGNLSMRVDGELMLIKASRRWMSRMTPDDVSLCLVSDGSLVEGPKPSVEIGFHAGVLRARPDANVVLHFQSPCATALACRRAEDINYFVIPEMPFYIGHVARVPFLPPGSIELARAVTEAMLTHDMAMMVNHGQVTAARDADHAIQNAVVFELACTIILLGGNDVMPLPGKDIEALLDLRRSAGAQA